jgi:streptomycin 6-kinase
LLVEELGIDSQRIINYAYIYGCLSSCWSLDDKGNYGENALKTSALLEPLVK